MTERAIDRFARHIVSFPRRQTLRGLAGGSLALFAGREWRAAAGDCPRRKRCGKGCCRDCFVKRDETGARAGLLCCKANRICEGLDGPESDQCCYADEVCHNNTCCRTCPDPEREGCCESFEFCNDSDRCEELGTARLPRFRR